MPLLAAFVAACSGDTSTAPPGLRLTILDAASGAPTPARVELVDALGVEHVPADALGVAGECFGHPPTSWDDAGRGVLDPGSARTHFYVTEPLEIALPPGDYRLTVHKGFEYERRMVSFALRPGERRDLEIELSRWAKPSDEGWYSADDHLHVSRPSDDVDAIVAQWMRAEDLNVANVLQMGNASGDVVARQREFGSASIYQEGDTIVASAQENPRTWILGHGIVLGADAYLDRPERYLVYRELWLDARSRGALNGYAHWRAPGLYLDVPFGWIDFLEVLQFGLSDTSALYEVWNLGFRVTPTAGTDFPCFPSGPPGSERFYTRVEGPLTYSAWLEGVRAGRTFVTNGPLLELAVDGVGIGGDVRLPSPGTVHVVAAVHFDPTRDAVSRLELLQEGEVVEVATKPASPGLIRLDVARPVAESTWLALRASGGKVAVAPVDMVAPPRASSAHTGAIFIEVVGGRPLAERHPAAELSRQTLAALDELEQRFSPEAIDGIRGPLAEAVTGITADVAWRDRAAVLEAIAAARSFYEGVAIGAAPAVESARER